MQQTIDHNKILTEGIALLTSGTTTAPKKIFQSPEKLIAANSAALDSQQLTKESKVYTVCKLAHAGGLLAQSLPALSIGASVTIEKFNAFRFMNQIHKYTHTHITPTHARLIMKTKSFDKFDFSGIWITCGSDPVDWNIIESFVSRGTTFMVNWGMTEIGPCAINTVFDSIEKVQDYKSRSINGSTLLGDTIYTTIKIIDDQLFVIGDICVYDDWFATGDLVTLNDYGELYYHGRM
jgi:acyl-CoA synthetase (AMP-forming)/AMP-acid ligase II